MPEAGKIVSSRTSESRWLVELSGEHDLATAPRVRAELDRVLADGASVVVDLSRVTFIDSSIVGILLNAHLGAADLLGQTLTVVAPPAGTPARLLDVVGAENVLPVFDSRADALAAEAAPGAPDSGP